MAKYQDFEELPVWQEAAGLYNSVLDLLEQPNVPLTSSFRNQLDRAALSVSNNVAEGFERATKSELLHFIGIARGSSGEVRSMMAVIKRRPKLRPHLSALAGIRSLAESCSRQLNGWEGSVEKLPFDGRRRLPEGKRRDLEAAKKASDFRLRFLRGLKPEHPLYNLRSAGSQGREAGMNIRWFSHLPSPISHWLGVEDACGRKRQNRLERELAALVRAIPRSRQPEQPSWEAGDDLIWRS